MQPIAYVISDIDKSIEFEVVAERLSAEGVPLHFFLLNAGDSYLEGFLRERKIPVERLDFQGGKSELPLLAVKLAGRFRQIKAKAAHAHLVPATLAGLSGAWLAGVKRRIHTRHHSSYHHMHAPHAVRYDRYANRVSTHIVAVSKVVAKILTDWDKANADKIKTIPHGVDVAQFANVSQERIRELRAKYVPEGSGPVVGAISRYINWKGVQYLIPAFAELLREYPDAFLLLANAKGRDAGQIRQLLAQLPPGRFREVEFEKDVPALYRLFDVFVHMPTDTHAEAFGQTYIEALAAGVPSVFTVSGVANDFVALDPEKRLTVAYHAEHQSSRSLLEGMRWTLNPANAADREAMRFKGQSMVRAHFSQESKIAALLDLYRSL